MDDNKINPKDKIDWRLNISRSLDLAIRLKGSPDFPRYVDIAYDMVSLPFPNLDCKKELDVARSRLETKINTLYAKWLDLNPTSRREQRFLKRMDLRHALASSLLAYLSCYVADKNMLLMGETSLRGGEQLNEDD